MADNDGTPDAKDSVIEYDFSEEAEQNDQVEQDTTTKESSTEETKAPETAEQKQETEETEEATDTQEQTEGSEETNAEEKPKAKNSAENRIRSLVSEKRELKRQIEELTAQAYKPATVDELKEQGMDDAQAQIEALRQEQAIKEYNSHALELTSDLNMESMQVLNDFPVFNPDSPEYDKEFAETVSSQYVKASGIKTDPKTGHIVSANLMPYDYFKDMAKIHSRTVQKGEITGKRAAEKQLAAVETPGTTKVQEAPKDPVLEELLRDD